ncbi:MAG: succinate dehydrogenase, cytochrome b556 subunit [candidate division KSB1 bacterium]|nr:succinate dehydrogenase, cytochrome b556 subunit [candidate division KSB1 bacterium]
METKIPTKLTNRLGLWGWLGGGRYGIERYAYSLHRLTGIVLILYLPLHLYITSVRLQGEAAWENLMARFDTPLMHVMEYLLFGAFLFHGLNGLRLFFTELGFFVGKPAVPAHPYRTSVHRQRPVFIIAMLLAGAFFALGAIDFFGF